MRLESIASEAWRNLRSGASHAVAWTLVVVALIGGLAVAETNVVRGLVDQALRFQAVGSNVTIFVANAAIDGATCQSLTEVPGVTAAGALRSSTTPPVTFAALPSGPIPAFEVTPGLTSLLGVGALDAGVLLPDDLGRTLAARAGSELLAADGAVVRVAGTFPFPSDGRATDLQNAVLEPTVAVGAFDQCWVETWPDDPNVIGLSRLVLVTSAPAGTTVSTGALNPTLGTSFDGARRFDARPTAPAWAAAMLAGLVVGASSVHLRRRHLAEARHAGVGVPAQLLQVLLETGAVLVAAMPAVLLACAAAAPGTDALAGWALGARVAVVGAAATLLGAAGGVATIRSGLLMRYVKD